LPTYVLTLGVSSDKNYKTVYSASASSRILSIARSQLGLFAISVGAKFHPSPPCETILSHGGEQHGSEQHDNPDFTFHSVCLAHLRI
jgi:hypothetical protein